MTGEDGEVLRENIARAISDNIRYAIKDNCGHAPYAETFGVDAAADAVLALIGPVMEENERLKQKLRLKIEPADPVVFEDEPIADELEAEEFDSEMRAALSPKSEKQDG